MRFFAWFSILLLCAGCGYQPTATITRDIVGENVYVDVVHSKRDPQNTVAIKDGTREAVIKRLGRDLSDEKSADTVIVASIGSLKFSSLSYDTYGYTTSYKATLTMNYRVKFKDGTTKNFTGSGDYDFTIAKRASGYADSVISDTDRYNAIKNASEQCFDEFISRLAIEGFRHGKSDK